MSGSGFVSSTRYEADATTYQLISKSPLLNQTVDFDAPGFAHHLEDPPKITIIKLQGNPQDQELEALQLRKYRLNIPTMIRCQNCETNYPTKYQYQRHQCEFNAEKVVLKPNADVPDPEKKTKYECGTCLKQFVSKNNLERHKTSHDAAKENVCKYCSKKFVSENRLRIHKENHCKKAGDISKFYRSDVTVWRCRRCQEVFSSSFVAAHHAESCTEMLQPGDIKQEDEENVNLKIVEKTSTEILLQCEFCNRTFAEKKVLLNHQKTHKTDKNYECVICGDVFTSYITASQHWLKKCSDKANLFYLPKLTYCEFCDRTFKSHELLYTHKIKKKHYTAKLWADEQAAQNGDPNEATGGLKNNDDDVMDKLIEDVLIALEIPINNKKLKKAVEAEQEIETTEENKENEEPVEEEVEIKTEPQPEDDDFEVTVETVAPKKKRGRKRKMQKMPPKKKVSNLDQGYRLVKKKTF